MTSTTREQVVQWHERSGLSEHIWFGVPARIEEEKAIIAFAALARADLEAENVALRAEVERLSKLAYVGEHQFDDYTWKYRHNDLSAELAAAKKTSDELLAALERLKASFEYGQFVGIAPDGCARAKAFIISAIASAKGGE